MTSFSTPLIIAAVAVLIFFRLRRRLRPGPVRPSYALIYLGIICLITAVSVVNSSQLLLTPLGASLVPVMLVIGAALGSLPINRTTFYQGPDGRLWARDGGWLFIGIFLAIVTLRLLVRYAATGALLGQPASIKEPGGVLNILSADLLFLSVGVWGVRAYLLWRRYRAYQPPLRTAS